MADSSLISIGSSSFDPTANQTISGAYEFTKSILVPTVSLNDVLSTMDENLSISKQVYNYNKKLAKHQPQQEDEGDNNFETQASALEYLAGRPSIKPIPLRARNWDERHDVHDVKKDGSFRPISKKGF